MLHSVKAMSVVLSLLILAVVPAAVAQAVSDRVRLTRGSETGEVTEMTPLAVTLKKGAPGSETVAVNEIKSIVFDGEPAELSQARVNAANGAYQNALATLARINDGSLRDFIQQDVAFYKAWCAAHLALAGDGEIADAGRQLNNFVRNHPQNFHYLAAVEMMGDLLMAGERYEHAQKQYAELAKTPWPEYKMRAAVLIGRTLQAQGKHAEAIRQFDAALAVTSADGAESQSQRLAATLGKAVSLAESGGVDEAVNIIEKVIHDADPQQKELHARAYNALGRCYGKAGKTKDALLAYLHVDVLYNNVPEAHAEALAHLAPLWKAIGQDERAREARQLLEERYGSSRWARQSE